MKPDLCWTVDITTDLCTECVNDGVNDFYLLDGGTCIFLQACTSRQQRVGQDCVDLPPNCEYVVLDDPTTCSQCFTGYEVYESLCVEVCGGD